MKIIFERQAFLKKLLDPISKVADQCILYITPIEVYSIATSKDGGIILYNKLTCSNTEVKEEIQLNLPNIRKLLQAFEFIDDYFIELQVETNHLAYSSPNIKFKYFLLDDGVIEKPPIKVEKINGLQFDCDFNLGSIDLSNLLKSSSFSSESDKVYFYTKDKEVYAELTDQAVQNTDSITLKVANDFNGTELKQVLPLNMEIIRLIGSIKTDLVKVKINTEKSILLFEISSKEHITKFIVSSLVK